MTIILTKVEVKKIIDKYLLEIGAVKSDENIEISTNKYGTMTVDIKENMPNKNICKEFSPEDSIEPFSEE